MEVLDQQFRFRLVSGQHLTGSASEVINTSLSTVLYAVASLEDAPVLGCDRATASVSGQPAGAINLRTWKPTAAGDATPIAATTFGRRVSWFAFGR